jgi:hypothetical protein
MRRRAEMQVAYCEGILWFFVAIDERKDHNFIGISGTDTFDPTSRIAIIKDEFQ